MMTILDGGKKATFQRQWIQGAHDDVFDGKMHPDVEVHAEVSREESVQSALQHFMNVHWKHLEKGYKPKGEDMTFMSAAKFGKTGPLSLHYGVFMSTLRSQTSDEQKRWWLGRAQKLGFIGCYAQTELGHGSNVRGLQTTATFVPRAGPNQDGEWVLNTPTLQSMKWWSTGMYSSTHAAVYAQMVLKGKPMGVHVFLVQMRGPDFKPLVGIEVGDIGAKLGDNDATIGYLRMRNVHIPRRHLMERRQHVTPDGHYIKAPPPGSMDAKPAGQKQRSGGSKSHYITMLKTRVALTNTAGASLAKACVIAARYSALRHQGFKNTDHSTQFNSAENQILDYQVQLYRVLKWTSCAYALKLVARWLLLRRKAMESSEEGDKDLPEIHASAAGLKAYGCVLAADGIEDLRRACGGHGYLMSSGIAPLEADFKGPNTTAEGDYVILSLQTARFLVRSVDTAMSGDVDVLPGLTKCLAPLASRSFDPVIDGKPSPPPRNVGEMLWSGADSRTYFVRLFQYRTIVSCYKAHQALHHSVHHQKLSVDEGRNQNARLLYTTAVSHVKYFMLSKFVESVDSIPDADSEGCKLVLHKLVLMFALQDILTGEGWVGLLTAREMSLVDSAVSELCNALRDDVIGLTDSFDFSDIILNSALGRSDGRVYEALYNAAKTSSLNIDKDTGKWIDSPPMFQAVERFIDYEFLRDGANHAPRPSKL
jgi:acyl-CoA oxidase